MRSQVCRAAEATEKTAWRSTQGKEKAPGLMPEGLAQQPE
jgi:hypothetical protein